MSFVLFSPVLPAKKSAINLTVELAFVFLRHLPPSPSYPLAASLSVSCMITKSYPHLFRSPTKIRTAFSAPSAASGRFWLEAFHCEPAHFCSSASLQRGQRFRTLSKISRRAMGILSLSDVKHFNYYHFCLLR